MAEIRGLQLTVHSFYLPELSLSIPLNSSHVNDAVEDDDDGDDTSSRDDLRPVVDDQVASGDFEWHHDGLKEEEVPASCKAERFVHVAARETDERRRDREIGCHFCHACTYVSIRMI